VPHKRSIYALEWAQRASEYSSPDCTEANCTAIELIPQFLWLGSTTDQEYEDLAVKAASTAIIHSAFEQALGWLEQVRCVVWNQRLMLQSLYEFQSLHPKLATRLRTTAMQFYQVTCGSPGSLKPFSYLSPQQLADGIC
jgi:hypothetical protein